LHFDIFRLNVDNVLFIGLGHL